METCCVLFVKEPRAGKVKTRLSPQLDPRQAADLYRAFVADAALTVCRSKADLKVVAYAPATAELAIANLMSDSEAFEFWPQTGASLGDRMKAAMRRSFDLGSERTVIIGSDSPSLPSSVIDDGLELLEKNDVVIGPSTDGGYYLVGQRQGEPRLFDQIQWSTGRVMEQSLHCLGASSLGLLPPWYDVDTIAEAAFLKIHLRALRRAGREVAPHTSTVIEALELPPPS